MKGKSVGDWTSDGPVVLMLNYAGRDQTIAVAAREEDAPYLAAAPDLFESLKEILNYRGGADSALEDEDVMDRARAAIKKADR